MIHDIVQGSHQSPHLQPLSYKADLCRECRGRARPSNIFSHPCRTSSWHSLQDSKVLSLWLGS
ncbi:unnamed protein product [Brassica rapa subsp. narinosa]